MGWQYYTTLIHIYPPEPNIVQQPSTCISQNPHTVQQPDIMHSPEIFIVQQLIIHVYYQDPNIIQQPSTVINSKVPTPKLPNKQPSTRNHFRHF